jgi:multidrug efflux pump subunit AcrA (membrane-fusion protein)
VEEARTRLSLARSRLSRDQAELRRLEGLSANGAVSTAELDAARLNVEVRQVEVSVAAAGVGVTESGARPEALAEVEAQIAAQEARIAAMEAVLAQDLVRAPFAGRLTFGRAAEPTLLLAIEDTSTAVIRVPVPQQEAGRVKVGATAWVEGPGFAHTEGKVIDVATAAEQIGGQPMIWIAMTVPNAEGAFKTGMTARVEMEATGLSLQHLLRGAS